MIVTHVFSAHGIWRAAERRRDAGWLEAARREPRTRVVAAWGDAVLVRQRGPLAGDHWAESPGATATAALLTLEELAELAAGMATEVANFALLGEDDGGAPLLAALLRADVEPSPPDEMLRFVELRRVGAILPARDAALLAHARALAHWHARHRFCGTCGAPTASAEAGHVRACTNAACGAQHYPRVDPAVIALVIDPAHPPGERCLLGRQASWPPRRYSALAGFVEPGESLEDAVAREVREETGLRVDDVRYHSSQPWPFPSSLMLGFTARYAGGVLDPDGAELEDARWFTRSELRAAVQAGEVLLPSRVSIARALIEGWMR